MNKSKKMKLKSKVLISGEILVLSGMLIGSNSGGLGIGGPDKQVIRNPITKLPYIPGSSLKGKMRSLIELRDGTINFKRNNGPSNMPESASAKLFGYTGAADKSQQPSRLIVRDGELMNPRELDGKTELLYTEVKAENSIDRITAKANPRFFERVPSGARFKMDLVLNIFESDDEDLLFNTLWQSLLLIQNDYLGAGGSRGNGMVSIRITKVQSRSNAYYLGNGEKKDIMDQLAIDPDLLTHEENSNNGKAVQDS